MMYLRLYLITIFVVLSFFLQAQEVIQKEGLAKLWESSEYAHQYAALHQDAPIGTLIEVKNLKNDRIVIVEVVGKPEDSDKSNTLIHISQKAYTRLESANPLFTVNIKYKPENPQNSFVVDPILWKQESQAQKNPFENPFQPNLMPNSNVSTPNQPIFHTVNPSERNIYDIARQYNIYDARKIAEWNDLGNNYVLTPGHRLLIYANISAPVLANTSYKLPQEGQVSENGFAEVLRDINDPKPFVALHASAPVGTLITLRNPSNGKSVVVTVLGSLNNAGFGTIIQITEPSYIRLGAVQSKFPVSINYIGKSGNTQNNPNPNNSPNGSVKYGTSLSTKVAYLPSDILTDKWWVAFHKNAPVGSYIQVRNPQNNQSVTFLVAGPLQGSTTDNQVMMQIGQAGMHALNQGEVVDQLAVTMELVKGASEGDMERIIRDITNVFEEGVGVSMNVSNTYKNPQNFQPNIQNNYSTPIIHTVQSGETINQITTRYNIRRSELRFWNNLQDDRLTPNQALNIYLPRQIIHIVKAGETKENIANLYQVSPIQIDIWNNLRTQSGPLTITPGQNIVLYLTTGPRPNGLQNAPQIFQSQANVSNSKPTNLTQKAPKYTCLHKTAPIGTLILVEKPTLQAANRYSNRNEYNANPFNPPNNYNSDPFAQLNNPVVYNNNNSFNPLNNQVINPPLRNSLVLEVVGKLPDTEENEDILIKLSEDAFQALTNEKNSLALKISYFEW